MEPVRKIMAAVGSSQYARGTFQYAAGLAKSMNADLIVASVINSRDVAAVRQVATMGYDIDGEHYIEGIRQERKCALEEYAVGAELDPKKLRIVFPVGNPIEELLKLIVQENVDMVVMGIKGKTDLEHIFIGSVAEKIFRRSPVTVVSYRDDEMAARLKKRINP